jgi:hypothetical protein
MNRTLRKLMIPGVGVVLATSGFAFMASNSLAESHAGSGEAAISGYTVSDVSYTIDTGHIGAYNENAANIATVSFTLDHPAVASNVSADFVRSYNGDVAKYSCHQSTGSTDNQHFTCTPDASEINLGDAKSLVVNAAQ